MTLEPYNDNGRKEKIMGEVDSTTDTVFIHVNIKIRLYAQSVNFGFSNICRATTKPGNGSRGMRDGIACIKFTSNNNFNGRPAGESLDGMILYKSRDKYTDLTGMASELSSRFVHRNAEDDEELYLVLALIERPGNTLEHFFKLEFEHESGSKMSSQMNLKWK